MQDDHRWTNAWWWLRLRKLASLIEVSKLDVKHLIAHRFDGFEHVEDALMLMKDRAC